MDWQVDNGHVDMWTVDTLRGRAAICGGLAGGPHLHGEVHDCRVLLHKERVLGEPLDVEDDKPWELGDLEPVEDHDQVTGQEY